MATKKRLDILLAERGLAPSREKARAMIMAGHVLVNNAPCDKAGTSFAEDVEIVMRGAPSRYVSRGGEKLHGAVEAFALDLTGLRCLDAGASTGGFTDCMLQHGAASVVAVDVGHGQLDVRLQNDPRVTMRDKTNARYLTPGDFPEPFDFITCDLSFISLTKVLPALAALLAADGRIVALIKPQFEAGRENIGKGGVVKNPDVHVAVINSVITSAATLGLHAHGITHSPITGPKGNIEYLMLMSKVPSKTTLLPDETVGEAFSDFGRDDSKAQHRTSTA